MKFTFEISFLILPTKHESFFSQLELSSAVFFVQENLKNSPNLVVFKQTLGVIDSTRVDFARTARNEEDAISALLVMNTAKTDE